MGNRSDNMAKRWPLIVVLAMCLLTGSESRAQNVLGSIGMQSPTAASLGRFGDLPVSLSKGSARLSIPLTALGGPSGEIALNLAYQATGIQVEQQATWVGLGWSLEVGGVITRTVRDLSDDNDTLFQSGWANYAPAINGQPAPATNNIKSGFYHNIGLHARYLKYIQSGWMDYFSSDGQINPCNSSGEAGKRCGLNAYVRAIGGGSYSSDPNDNIDSEADDYYFSFMGKSGRFYLDAQSGRFVNPSDTTVRIQTYLTNNEFVSWKLIDAAGTEYFFDKAEWTKSFSSDVNYRDNDPRYFSAWYLSKVKYYGSKDSLMIHYGPLKTTTWYPLVSRRVEVNGQCANTSSHCDVHESGGTGVNVITNYNRYEYIGRKPTRVDYQNKSILLYARTPRLDTPSTSWAIADTLLDSLVTIVSGAKVAKQVMEYQYAGLQSSTRLFLKGVVSYGSNNEVVGRHRFHYASPGLPDYGSTSVDRWGYYNGVNNGTNLIPAQTVVLDNASIYDLPDSVTIHGANKTPNISFAIAGSLSKIEYPTGGSLQIVYEMNDYSRVAFPSQSFLLSRPAGGLRVGRLIKIYGLQSDPISADTTSYEYKYSKTGCALEPNMNPSTCEWVDEDLIGVSSGVVSYEPRDYYVTGKFDPEFNSIVFTTNSKRPLGTGTTVDYAQVLQVRSGGAKSFHNFLTSLSFPDDLVDEETWPQARTTSAADFRGFERATVHVNQNGWNSTSRFRSPDYEEQFIQGASVVNRRGYLGVPDDVPYHTEYRFQTSRRNYIAIQQIVEIDSMISAGQEMEVQRRTVKYIPRTPLVSETQVSSGSTYRTQYLTYAFQHYPALKSFNLYALPYSSRAPGMGTWLTWGLVGSVWRQLDTFDWVGSDTVSIPATHSGTCTSPGAGFACTKSNVSFDSYGQVLQSRNAYGQSVLSRYGWANGTPGGPYRLADSTYTTQWIGNRYSYYADGLLRTITNVNGSVRLFSYDRAGRLSSIHDATNGSQQALLASFAYTLPTIVSGQLTQFGSVTTTTPDDASSTVSSTHVDGLGRPIQTVVKPSYQANSIVVASQYDRAGRSWRDWLPFEKNNGTSTGFVSTYAMDATAYYSGWAGTNSRPYTETLYDRDSQDRPAVILPPGVASTTEAIRHIYAPRVLPGGLMLACNSTRNEVGEVDRLCSSGFGEAMRAESGDTLSPVVTSFTYNPSGSLRQVTDPNGRLSRYKYDGRGLAVEEITPDAGVKRFKYDRFGSMRFWQDANMASAVQLPGTSPKPVEAGFTRYDRVGRPLVSGVFSLNSVGATWQSLQPDLLYTTAFDSAATDTWRMISAYDGAPTGGVWSRFGAEVSSFNYSSTKGRLAAMGRRSGNYWHLELYAYRADGLVVKKKVLFYERSTGSLDILRHSAVHEYQYTRQGLVSQRSTCIASQCVYHFSEYDYSGRATKVYASMTPHRPLYPDVEFSYWPTGAVSSLKYKGGTAVPFVYNIRGWLKEMGSVGNTAYPFSAAYSHLADGQVQAAEYHQTASPSSVKRYKYGYQYDKSDRLTSAMFGAWNSNSYATQNAHSLPLVTYDPAGNIMSLQRYAGGGAPYYNSLRHNLTYGYMVGSNRLGGVSNSGGPGYGGWSFQYDGNGNVRSLVESGELDRGHEFVYDERNQTTFYANDAMGYVTYAYNAGGQRYFKKYGSNLPSEYIVYDGSTPVVMLSESYPGSNNYVIRYWNIVSEGAILGRLVP